MHSACQAMTQAAGAPMSRAGYTPCDSHLAHGLKLQGMPVMEQLLACNMLMANEKMERKNTVSGKKAIADEQGRSIHGVSKCAQARQEEHVQHEKATQGQARAKGRWQRPPLTPAEVKAKSITSVMIHNLPVAVTQSDVVQELEDNGFGKLFDFLYVPYNLKTSSICGYAFVNLVSSDAAALLVRMWRQQRTLCSQSTNKPIFFSAADDQGFEALVQRLRQNNKRSLRDPRLRPVLRKVYPEAYAAVLAERSAHPTPTSTEPSTAESTPRTVHPDAHAAVLAERSACSTLASTEPSTAASTPRSLDPVYIKPDPTFFKDFCCMQPEACVMHL